MKVLYVSDLDGTLITRNERISEYSLGILNALIGRGLLLHTQRRGRSTRPNAPLRGSNIRFPSSFTTGR